MQYAGDVQTALEQLAEIAPAVVITLGEKGLIWRRGQERGDLSAFLGCRHRHNRRGDAFHGAFAGQWL